MKSIGSVLLHTLGYYAWIFGTLCLGFKIGGKLPQGDTQWLGVLFCITIGYFLLQVGLVHAKLERIETILKDKEKGTV